jgi:hypothetical protein
MSEGQIESEIVKAFLAEQDVGCPVCGYNLRDCPSPSCPECGAAIRLRLCCPDLRLGPWLFALLCFALPGGFAVVATMLGLVEWLRDPEAVSAAGATGPLVLGVVLCALFVVGAAVVITGRRRFWRQSRLRQWVTGWCCLSAALVVLALMIAMWIGMVAS